MHCRDCGAEYAEGPDEPWRCSCGGVLELDAVTTPEVSPATADLDRDRGLWAFDPFLPVEQRVSLGEGFTPAVHDPGLDAAVHLEYCSPTGSFKDRGAAVMLSRAAALGVQRAVEDSSGSAGLAVAAYASRAGIEAEIFVPADATPGKRRAIERTGATVIPIDGSREAVATACRERAAEDGVWYASHAWQPAFLAGTATLAYEIAARREWAAPDAVVLPIGHGTMFLGVARGFAAMERAGWIDRKPRLLGAQGAGYAPIVAAIGGDERSGAGRNELADGIQINEPVRREEIVEWVRSTDGDAIAVTERETRECLERLRHAGFDVQPTSAVAPAALERYRQRGSFAGDEDVVVPLTGRAI